MARPNSVLPCNWTLLAESASGGALQGGRVGLQTPEQEDLWASGMTGNDPRDFSVLSSSTASAVVYTLVLLSYICKGCVLFTAASTVHPFVPLLPGEKRLSRTMPLPVFGSVKAGLAFLFAVVHSLSIGA